MEYQYNKSPIAQVLTNFKIESHHLHIQYPTELSAKLKSMILWKIKGLTMRIGDNQYFKENRKGRRITNDVQYRWRWYLCCHRRSL